MIGVKSKGGEGAPAFHHGQANHLPAFFSPPPYIAGGYCLTPARIPDRPRVAALVDSPGPTHNAIRNLKPALVCSPSSRSLRAPSSASCLSR